MKCTLFCSPCYRSKQKGFALGEEGELLLMILLYSAGGRRAPWGGTACGVSIETTAPLLGLSQCRAVGARLANSYGLKDNNESGGKRKCFFFDNLLECVWGKKILCKNKELGRKGIS